MMAASDGGQKDHRQDVSQNEFASLTLNLSSNRISVKVVGGKSSDEPVVPETGTDTYRTNGSQTNGSDINQTSLESTDKQEEPTATPSGKLDLAEESKTDADFLSFHEADLDRKEESETSNAGSLTASELSTTRRVLFAEFCRICHESDGEEKFLSPCSCKGSLTLVHRSCLERWLAESDSSRCELCGDSFRMRRVPKYGPLASVWAWLTVRSTYRDRRKALLDLTAFLVLSPLIGVVNFLVFQLADRVFARDTVHQELTDTCPLMGEGLGGLALAAGEVGLLSVLLTADLAFASWALLRLQHHLSRWYSWYRRACVVTLLGYKEISPRRREPRHHSTSSLPKLTSIAF